MNRRTVDNVNKKSGEIFEQIHRIMHLFRSAQYRELRDGPHELTHLEGKLLGFFARHPGATLRDLVAHTRQDKGQLAKLIKSLRAQGLLAGEADAADRRSVRLSLTEAGVEIHESLHQRVGRLSSQAVKGIPAADRQELMRLLERVRGNLEDA